MAKKKKNFVISRDDLNIAVNEYLKKGGKITQYECTVPEPKSKVSLHNNIKEGIVSLSTDYNTLTPVNLPNE